MEVRVNKQNIEKETLNAVLIKMPNKSKYKDFCFWVSKRFIKKGSHKYEMIVWFGDNFKIKCTRVGKNFDVLAEVELSASEVKECFNGSN